MTKPPSNRVPPPAATKPTAPSGADRITVPLHSAESITELQVCGTRHALKLPPKNTMRLGRGDVELRLPDDVPDRDLVSREHVEITREGTEDGTWLRVVDLDSRYGTYFSEGREREFYVRAGQRFRVANTELMVMDRLLARLRHGLGGFFGYSNHVELDRLAAQLSNDVPVLLIGDRGSERGHLAKAIHDASPRRGNPFVVIREATAKRDELEPQFRAAINGTVFVSLDQIGPRARIRSLIELMFDEDSAVRPIITARDQRVVCDALSTSMPQFMPITVPPVVEHRADVPAILDTMLEEAGSARRVSELAASRRAAMCNYEWPRNRAELRETAERIAALLDHDGNMAAAAAFLDEDYEWFRRSLAKVGAVEVRRRGE